MGAREHGQGGWALAPLWKCFYALQNAQCIALFSQPVVSFWGLHPQTPTGGPFPSPDP